MSDRYQMPLQNSEINPNTITSAILAGQFVLFGWRINREIPVGDSGRRTWFPISDFVNVISLFMVVAFCVVEPLTTGQFTRSSLSVLAAACVLLAFHPIAMIGHYRLLTRYGRHVYLSKCPDFPYCTVPEGVFIALGVLAAITAATYVWLAS